MHGIGQRFSSHPSDPPKGETGNKHMKGETEHKGSCHKSYNLAKQQRESYGGTEAHSNQHKSRKGTYQQLGDIFGNEYIEHHSIVELTDGALPGYCHYEAYPCRDNADTHSTGTCVSKDLLSNMKFHADDLYCQRYAGGDGGRKANQLAMYPFLQEILDHLSEGTEKSKPPLAIFSGHDSVIAAVLGTYLYLLYHLVYYTIAYVRNVLVNFSCQEHK